MLHTPRHCARPGAVDWYTRSYKDLVAYVDLRSFLWLPRQTLRESGLCKTRFSFIGHSYQYLVYLVPYAYLQYVHGLPVVSAVPRIS